MSYDPKVALDFFKSAGKPTDVKKGAFEGFYPMSFVIRDEKIVAVNNGPDDFGAIGARYAREQCAQMGAPFIQVR